jgi:hypothetical protein
MAVLLLGETTFVGNHCRDLQRFLVDADIPLLNEYYNSDHHQWRVKLFRVEI